MEIKDVKIIRLTSGEDLIAGLLEADGTYYLKSPMIFILKDTGRTFALMLQNWLPVQIMKMNEAVLKSKDILLVSEPEENFAEYYLNQVEEMEEEIQAKLELKKIQKSGTDDPDSMDWIHVLEDMEISKNELIH
jgi:translation elongation factor EF-G